MLALWKDGALEDRVQIMEEWSWEQEEQSANAMTNDVQDALVMSVDVSDEC